MVIQMLYRGFSDSEKKMMYRCSFLYYRDGLTQEEIGKKLGITRHKVSDYLKEAADTGILSIKAPRVYELEGKLIKEFGLWDVRVTMVTDKNSENEVIESLGIEAASYFEEKVKDGTRVGLSGGRTIAKMVNELEAEKYENLEVYPLAVGGGPKIVDISANTLVALLCMKNPKMLGYILQSPPFIFGSEEQAEAEKNRLLSRPDLKEVYESAMRVELGFTGIGCLNTLSVSAKSLTPDPDALIMELKAKGAVGDISYQAFGINGQIIDCDFNKRVIAIPLEWLQKITRSSNIHIVGVGGGPAKVEAILGAIKGGFIDVLITDEYTAVEVLKFNPALLNIK